MDNVVLESINLILHIIDTQITDISNQKLCDSNKMQDNLLDIRLEIESLREKVLEPQYDATVSYG